MEPTIHARALLDPLCQCPAKVCRALFSAMKMSARPSCTRPSSRRATASPSALFRARVLFLGRLGLLDGGLKRADLIGGRR
jgi:hypothetical protein